MSEVSCDETRDGISVRRYERGYIVVRIIVEVLGITVVVIVVVVVVVVGYFVGPIHIRKMNRRKLDRLTIGLNRPNTHFLCL